MREININLSNLEEQYDCGHCGEAKASELKIDISNMAEADFYVVVFKNSFSQTYCTERFYAEDIKENVIHIALWQDLTKTDKERAVVEAYIEENGKLKMLEKSPVIHLHFDGSISSDKALSEKEPEGLYLSLLKLEGNLKNDMDVLNTIISDADDSVRNANTAADNAKKITDEITDKLNNGELKGEKGDTGAIGPPGATGPPGKDAVTDVELSVESSNAIANKAVANILSSGNLIGIEKMSSLEDFEQFSKKYEDVPAVDNQYLLLFVTGDIYSGEDLVLEEGLIVLTPTGEYKLTCNKEFEEFKKAVEMNFNLFFQALGNYATREKLEQVKADLLRSIELLQSQTEQKITTNKNNLLQLTARVDELEKEWITVCDDTLTEDISFLLKTTDAEGNPFSFKKLKVYIYSPVNEATGNTGVRIINSINYSDMDNILVQTSNWFMNSLSQHCVATVDCGGFAVTETNRGPTMATMNNTGIMGVNFNVESITSVLIRPVSTTAKMIPGTRIVVKGC